MCASVCGFHIGGESGKVHSTVRARWLERDPALLSGMKELGDLSDLAVMCLDSKNAPGLAGLMERNFEIRRALYTDCVVGATNIEMVALAASLGFSAKFTGSGGALLLLCKESQGWYEYIMSGSVCVCVCVCVCVIVNIPFYSYIPEHHVNSYYSLFILRLEESRESAASSAFEVHGFKFVRIEVA